MRDEAGALFITPTPLAGRGCRGCSADPMAQETFAFSSSALRSLRAQRELLEREERRRALAREWAARRLRPPDPRPPPTSTRRPRCCRDPAVHNALYAGDLQRVKGIFRDESTANMVLETVSEELVWSPEQGMGGRGGAVGLERLIEGAVSRGGKSPYFRVLIGGGVWVWEEGPRCCETPGCIWKG